MPQEKPLNLYNETSGEVLVKFFFQKTEDLPEGIPEREARTSTFRTENGRRADTGTEVINAQLIGADFLRTGIANTDGHAWKCVEVCQWTQPVTNPRMREKHGPTQTVVMLRYKSNPSPEDVTYFGRSVLQAIRDLSRSSTWNVKVWHNHGGPATINFTAPTSKPPREFLVVEKGCLVLVPAATSGE